MITELIGSYNNMNNEKNKFYATYINLMVELSILYNSNPTNMIKFSGEQYYKFDENSSNRKNSYFSVIHGNNLPFIFILFKICNDTLYIFVYIRGTYSFKDAKADIKFRLTSLDIEHELKKCGVTNINLHSGFSSYSENSFGLLMKKIGDFKKWVFGNYENVKYIFGGHSMGGAIITVLTMLMIKRFEKKILLDSGNLIVMTFGCPRIGTDNFNELLLSYLSEDKLKYVRIFDNNDLFVDLPKKRI